MSQFIISEYVKSWCVNESQTWVSWGPLLCKVLNSSLTFQSSEHFCYSHCIIQSDNASGLLQVLHAASKAGVEMLNLIWGCKKKKR